MGTFASRGHLTSAEQETAVALKQNLKHLISPAAYGVQPFKDIYDTFMTASTTDLRPYLSGVRNISNVLKIFAALFRFYEPQNEETAVILQNILRACYYFDSYRFSTLKFFLF